MKEMEWLSGSHPDKMLKHLKRRASDRKLRLFSCACCRSIWHLLPDAASRAAVEMAERFADQQVTRKALNVAVAGLDPQAEREVVAWRAAEAAWYTAAEILQGEAAYFAASQAVEAASESLDPLGGGASARAAVAGLILDIFGNPFRPTLVNPAWLAWNDGTVRCIAEGIYDERAFDRLPILADALEDAGCTNADILNHCRGEGPHVIGCWPVDLLLRKA